MVEEPRHQYGVQVVGPVHHHAEHLDGRDAELAQLAQQPVLAAGQPLVELLERVDLAALGDEPDDVPGDAALRGSRPAGRRPTPRAARATAASAGRRCLRRRAKTKRTADSVQAQARSRLAVVTLRRGAATESRPRTGIGTGSRTAVAPGESRCRTACAPARSAAATCWSAPGRSQPARSESSKDSIETSSGISSVRLEHGLVRARAPSGRSGRSAPGADCPAASAAAIASYAELRPPGAVDRSAPGRPAAVSAVLACQRAVRGPRTPMAGRVSPTRRSRPGDPPRAASGRGPLVPRPLVGHAPLPASRAVSRSVQFSSTTGRSLSALGSGRSG